MSHFHTRFTLLTLTGFVAASILSGQTATSLSIDLKHPKSAVSPTLYGLMTEEINYSYDGGLYAEMVRNRTFQPSWQGFAHWLLVTKGSSQAKIEHGDTGPSTALSKSLKLTVTASDEKNEAGIANTG